MPKIKIKKAWIPVAIVLGFVLVILLIRSNPPEIKRKPRPQVARLSVEVMRIQPSSYQVQVQSYGTVKPRTQGELISQVSGKIISISDNFRAGGFFKRDELLIKIDPDDFEAELKSAKAALMSAQQVLAEEQARADVALQDWNRLGKNKQTAASALALRQPQLRAAKAGVESAEAALLKADLNLNRTEIRAPYAGRVLNTHVDIGQVVIGNKNLADIFATDVVEIRLPIKNKDLRFIDLPEKYSQQHQKQAGNTPDGAEVQIVSRLVEQQQWQGRLVRTEGAIDATTQQLHVIAQITDPYGVKSKGKQPLKIGQYVTAVIQGRTLDNALVIPNEAIYQGSYVYTVEQGVLRRKEVVLAWQNQDDAIVESGLKAGDALVLTALGQVTSGTRVKVSGEAGMDSQRGVVAGSPPGDSENPRGPPGSQRRRDFSQPTSSDAGVPMTRRVPAEDTTKPTKHTTGETR